jgi:hypothetical protein
LAFTQISTSVTILNSGQIGYIGISLTNFTTSAASLIASGSGIEIGGGWFKADTDITPNASSWTAITTATTAYLGLTPSGTAGSQIISAAWLSYAPAWSTSKQGWYASVASVSRVVASAYKVGPTSYSNKVVLNNPQHETNWDAALNNQLGSEWGIALNTNLSSGWSTIFSSTPFYDLVIDSNAKLDLLCQAVSGQYKRVLVRNGTWVASSLSPTANVLINLDNTGTIYMFGEPGSLISYTTSTATSIYGLYHATISSIYNSELFDSVAVAISNTNVGYGNIGFCNCRNLRNCQATTGPCGGIQGAFSACTKLYNCKAITSATGGQALGFSSCTDLVSCSGVVSTNSVTAQSAYGFISCVGIVLCQGQGANSGAGGGYGFYQCSKMQQNKAYATCKTAIYSASYADAGTGNACADTAAGGYNS